MELANNSSLITDGGISNLPRSEKVLFANIYGSITVFGLLGNMFIIWAIGMDPQDRKSTINIMLLNLAIADFGNLATCVTDLVLVVHDQGWVLPEFLCPILHGLTNLFLYASILTQVAVCIERYLAICSPFSIRRLSIRKVSYCFFIIWVLAGLMAVPNFIFQTLNLYPKDEIIYQVCAFDYSKQFEYRVFKCAEMGSLYFAPLFILSILYFRTCQVLWGSVNIENLKMLHDHEEQALKIWHLRRSVIKMLIICLSLYFIFYSPIQVLTILEFTNFTPSMGPEFWMSLSALPLACSAANPVVYTACCHHFRDKFMSIFRKRKKRRRSLRRRDGIRQHNISTIQHRERKFTFKETCSEATENTRLTLSKISIGNFQEFGEIITGTAGISFSHPMV